VKRVARPKPERIPSILRHCAHHLNWDRDKQVRQHKKPEPGKSPGSTRFIQLVAKCLFERTGIGLVKSGWVKFDQPPVKSN
jgi:hypothetical protein